MKPKATPETILRSKETRIVDCTLNASPVNYNLKETVAFTLALRVGGPLRETFTQSEWEKAYDEMDTSFRLTIRTGLHKSKLGIARESIIKPEKLVRKGVLFWTRNPDLPYRVWAMIVNEYGQPTVPRSIDEAQGLLFDLTKTYEVEGSRLGVGPQTIGATVRAEWGRHTYVEKGRTEAASEPIKVKGLRTE